jgi:hypothetical protein
MSLNRIKLFDQFIAESSISIKDPGSAGDVFAGVIAGHKNIKEEPKGSNTGNMVNQYLASVGLGPGLPWCAAFVYYVFDQFTKRLGVKNELPKTGGCMNHWERADKNLKIPIADVKNNPSLVKPGQIFIMTRPGKGLGHTGIVIDVDPQRREFISIEGNTNDQASGEGDRVGVNRRKIDSTRFVGFIDYFKGSRTPEFEKELRTAIDKSKIPLAPLSNQSASPSDAVVSGYGEELGNLKTKPAGFMAKILSGVHSTVTGKLAQPEEIQAQIDKLR